MSTKIAIIGSHEFINQILTVAAKLTDVVIDPYVYLEPQDAAQLIKKLKPCDVVFFSGALPYYFSKDEHEKLPVPVLYLAQDEMAVASSLLHIIYNKKISLQRISIDLFDCSIISNVLADSEIHAQPLWIVDYHHLLEGNFDLSKLVDFHYTLWQHGTVDLALTSVHAIYNRLQSLGVPAIRMADPRSSMLVGLQKAKAQAELYKSKSAQVAVGYLSQLKPQREQIDNFAKEINSSVQMLNDQSFVFYTTRGDIEDLIENNNLDAFLEKWHKPAILGFGYGSTIKEADQHAKIALRFAEQEASEKCAFILTENKELLGPYPYEHKQHHLKYDQPEFLKIAELTKLSPINLSKIIEFSKSRPSLQFTTADLTDYLQVTRRSTERIVKKLVDARYVKVVGEEMTYHQGRPRAVYELNMPVYL